VDVQRQLLLRQKVDRKFTQFVAMFKNTVHPTSPFPAKFLQVLQLTQERNGKQ